MNKAAAAAYAWLGRPPGGPQLGIGKVTPLTAQA